MKSLPIDEIIQPLRHALAHNSCAVLQAEPGAGKTTRVPLALLHEAWLGEKKILLLEPRRLAAVHAARYMSGMLGEKPGQTIGYTIRYERAVTAATRIEVVTEGVLTRRLQHDPELRNVGLIIFDEFHERNIHSDLGLALSLDVQQSLRPDLRLLLMSATLDTEQLAQRLDQCPVLHSAGRSYPVSVFYREADATPLPQQVCSAVREGLQHPGDILVFLPGAGEINRCATTLKQQAWAKELQVLPLYGALPFAQQCQALESGQKRKVVLATNIAETSLTIDGVGVVVDSGLERQLEFDPARGMERLLIRRIAQSSATQRAGRAGRQRSGFCYRLWGESLQHSLVLHQIPEVMRTDLSPLALELVAWGVQEPETLRWIDNPPAAHMVAAFTLLRELGALDREWRLTPVGRKMVALPLHPRLARMVVAAVDPSEQELACRMATILDAPHLFRHGEGTGAEGYNSGDLFDLLEQWRPPLVSTPAAQDGRSPWWQANRNLEMLRQRLGITAKTAFALNSAAAAQISSLLLYAYPDRIAQRREGSRERYLLRSGKGACLAPRTRVVAAEWLVVPELEYAQGAEALIRMGFAMELEQIRQIFEADIRVETETIWDSIGARVTARRCRRLGSLILQQEPVRLDANRALQLLLEQIRARGLEVLTWTATSTQLYARIRFVARHNLVADWPAVEQTEMLTHLEDWLAPFLTGVTSLAALKQVDLVAALQSMLSWEQQRQLDSMAPERFQVPSGSKVRIDYGAIDCGPNANGDSASSAEFNQPRLAVKLQEMFGLRHTPTVGNGRVPVLIDLLSPARRPIQTTTDLESFWANTYTEVKKELKGRYPKHPWPDDPTTAPPQRGVKRRT
ncbi:MAG: ATP-dependent helicase HrpB [Desulfuromonas sp.]|nr:ATP-dependent helicase HrpB [Desulfuromonas sp.]